MWVSIPGAGGGTLIEREDTFGSRRNVNAEIIMAHRSRIMYIEDKSEGLVGPARIGRVTYSKTGKSLSYRGHEYVSLRGAGFKANFWEVESGKHYWISGCKKDGLDSLYANVVEIDEDVREEYWVKIRNKPAFKTNRSFKCIGKYSK